MKFNKTKTFGIFDNMTPAQKQMFWQRVKLAGMMGLIGGGGMWGMRKLSEWYKNNQMQNQAKLDNMTNGLSNATKIVTNNAMKGQFQQGGNQPTKPIQDNQNFQQGGQPSQQQQQTQAQTQQTQVNTNANAQQATQESEPDMSNWTDEQISEYNSSHYNYPDVDFTGQFMGSFSDRSQRAITKFYNYYEPPYENKYPSYIHRNYPSLTPRGTYINDEYIDENLQHTKPSFNTREDAKKETKRELALWTGILGGSGYGGYKAYKHFFGGNDEDEDNNNE